MNVSEQLRETAVRFSFGPHTTKKGVDELAAKTAEIAARFN